MNSRRLVRKIAAVGAGGAMLGATLMGALAADLADYPTQFMENNAFDGKIIIGANAATSDVIGAIDIAASLQAASVTESPIDVPGTTRKVLSGDTAQFKVGGDILELGENVSDVKETFTENDLDALQGGRLTPKGQGATDYKQYLRFDETNIVNMYVDYTAGDIGEADDVVGDFLVIPSSSSEQFFEYELEFTSGLEAEAEDCNTGVTSCELDDYEDLALNVFGTEYTVVDTEITSSEEVTIEMMGGEIADTLRQGETKTYTIDGKTYEVTALFISNPNTGTVSAKLSVNGAGTSELEEGETETVLGTLELGVRDILVSNNDAIVTFFLGANSVTFTDANYSDDAWDGTVEFGTEDIDDASLDIKGTLSGTFADGVDFEISSIVYRLEAQPISGSTLYVPAGYGVRNYLETPQGMLNPSWDIRYEGLTEPERTDIEMDPKGDDGYELVVTNMQGDEFTIPYMEATGASTFEFGDDEGADKLWFFEGNPTNTTCTPTGINTDDYFIVSGMDSAGIYDDNAFSGVFQYDSYDAVSSSDPTGDLKIRMVGGDSQEVSIEDVTAAGWPGGVRGEGEISFGGKDYTVYVCNTSQDDSAILVDLDSNGTITADAEVRFTVFGGGVLDLTNETTWAANNATQSGTTMTLVTISDSFDESSDGNETLTWKVSATSASEVSIGSLAYARGGTARDSNSQPDWSPVEPEDNEDHSFEMTDYGVLIDLDDGGGSDETDTLTLSYPEEQVEAQVYVVAGAVESVTAGGAGGMQQILNPLAVGLAVLDTEAPSIGSEDLIVVGGPCVNDVAASLMGNPDVCTAGFSQDKAIIKFYEQPSGTVALLVAGYEAKDTQGASRVLAQFETFQEDGSLSGDEVEVTVFGLSNLQVSTPTTTTAPADDSDDMVNESEETEE